MPVLFGQERSREGSQPEHAVPSPCWLMIPYYKIKPSDLMLYLSPTTPAWKQRSSWYKANYLYRSTALQDKQKEESDPFFVHYSMQSPQKKHGRGEQ